MGNGGLLKYVHSQARKAHASRIIPMVFSDSSRAIGTITYKDKSYLVATNKQNDIIRLYGQCKMVQLGLKSPPATGALEAGVFLLKVSHPRSDRSDYYHFLHLSADKRAEFVSKMDKDRSAHTDSIGRG
jgi:hypothetical protein